MELIITCAMCRAELDAVLVNGKIEVEPCECMTGKDDPVVYGPDADEAVHLRQMWRQM